MTFASEVNLCAFITELAMTLTRELPEGYPVITLYLTLTFQARYPYIG